MTLVLHDRVRTLFLWLSLAVVLTCALGSYGSAVRPTSGSAFNAFTSDVSLGPTRATAPERDRKEQMPGTGGAGQAKAAIVLPALPPPPPVPAFTYSQAPLAPPIFFTAGAVGARAPPRA